MELFSKIVLLIVCHLLGDYVLQNDFIAKSKGSNWYHLFVHCALYIVPFIVIFGINLNLAILFFSHFIVDACKARWKRINYFEDQLIHYFILIIYLIN